MFKKIAFGERYRPLLKFADKKWNAFAAMSTITGENGEQ